MKNNSNDFDIYGFKRSDIEKIFGEDFLSTPFQNKPLSKNKCNLDTTSNINKGSNVEWEPKFAGRKHALEIISVLAIKLAEKSGNTFRHGDKISASTLAGMVADFLGRQDDQQFRKLIGDALKEAKLADND